MKRISLVTNSMYVASADDNDDKDDNDYGHHSSVPIPRGVSMRWRRVTELGSFSTSSEGSPYCIADPMPRQTPVI